jgi:amidophosphoribosyltransferase
LIGVRDPFGVRPLVLGRLNDAYILASETCALDIIGATYERDIAPGEMVVIDTSGLRSFFPFVKSSPKFCIFEYVYFARPDSFMEGRSVYAMRKAIGTVLAQEAPVVADIVVPVPDSGVPAAIGYSQASGIPFDLGIIRNHYVGRTFIEPTDQIRHLGVKLKHNANRKFIEGKRIVLVDDSIVRGTTSRKIVEMMRDAGAREVHMRISSPPTAHSCFYGIDTPRTEDLLAHSKSVPEIAEFIGVDSLSYISIDGLYRAVGELRRNNELPQFCDACFTGDYPIKLTDHENNDTGNNVSGLRERVRGQ